MTKRIIGNLVVLILALNFLACDSSDNPAGAPEIVFFVFSMIGDSEGVQNFEAQTNDPLVISEARAQLALPFERRQLFIIGPIARGSSSENFDWTWHFIPNEWSLTETAIELCDGNPVLVEQAVDYWVDTVGQFCPWGSRIVGEEGTAP